VTVEGTLRAAGAGRSVTVVLDRQVDIARGDILTHVHDAPRCCAASARAWCGSIRDPLAIGARYWLKHGAQTIARPSSRYNRDLTSTTLQSDVSAQGLAFNDIGMVRIAAGRAIAADPYAGNRATGSFILIDEATNHTVAAG
jgi:sulfate adenylyltransferase subunit 1